MVTVSIFLLMTSLIALHHVTHHSGDWPLLRWSAVTRTTRMSERQSVVGTVGVSVVGTVGVSVDGLAGILTSCHWDLWSLLRILAVRAVLDCRC